MLRVDKSKLTKLNALLLERGVLKGENKSYLSTTLTDADIDHTIEAWKESVSLLA